MGDKKEEAPKETTSNFGGDAGYQLEDCDAMTGMEGHKEYLEKYYYFDKMTKNKKAGISKGDPIYKEYADAEAQHDDLTLAEKEAKVLVKTVGT